MDELDGGAKNLKPFVEPENTGPEEVQTAFFRYVEKAEREIKALFPDAPTFHDAVVWSDLREWIAAIEAGLSAETVICLNAKVTLREVSMRNATPETIRRVGEKFGPEFLYDWSGEVLSRYWDNRWAGLRDPAAADKCFRQFCRMTELGETSLRISFRPEWAGETGKMTQQGLSLLSQCTDDPMFTRNFYPSWAVKTRAVLSELLIYQCRAVFLRALMRRFTEQKQHALLLASLQELVDAEIKRSA
jgi:hypothetical protein